jgi:uncharacterized integral membrane protein (TIGR00697 family)
MNFKYFHILSGLFVATLLISNTVAVKIISIGPFAIPAGILCFPLSYIFGDVLTEVYGYARSRSIIWTGFFCLALMSLFYWLAEILPPAPFWNNQTSFDAILGQAPRIAFASLVAYCIGEFSNSYVLSRMKIWTQGRYLWTRTIGSTIVGEAIDSVSFNLVAFAGVFGFSDLLNIIATGYVMKVLYEIVATPLTYKMVGFLKRAEQIDTFDHGTNYNPFLINEDAS